MPAESSPPLRRRQMSARLRLTLSYAAFLVVAGAVTLVGVYIFLRFVREYSLATANPVAPPSIASRQEILEAVVGASAAILAALAVIGLAGGWLLAGWILRPLEDINAAARLAAAGKLDHRIRLAGRSDEFGQLADNFDYMLERLHDAFLTQERFAANASHELRTPLAVTATLLDVARADPDARYDPELLERLQIINGRAIELTEALLRLADANAVTASAEPTDLAALARVTLEDQRPESDLRQVAVRAELAEAPVLGDPTLLGQLIANLVQNAIRHNHPGGEAWVTTGPAATSGAALRVENTGPTHGADDVARLVEPFLRGGGRIAAGEDRGYGLGLALVARIVDVHDGSLEIRPRPGGGLIVTATLPGLTR